MCDKAQENMEPAGTKPFEKTGENISDASDGMLNVPKKGNYLLQ
jgi:hypothetical protein